MTAHESNKRILASDLIAATIATALGAYALFEARGMSTLGAVFPITAAIVLLAGGVAILVLSLTRSKTPAVARGTEWGRFVWTVGVLFAWALLLKPLGFMVTSAIAMLLLMLATMRKRLTLKEVFAHAATGLILIAAFLFVMRDVLKVKSGDRRKQAPNDKID